MSAVDTTAEAVARRAAWCDAQANHYSICAGLLGQQGDARGAAIMGTAMREAEDAAATLRALMAERDAARAEAQRLRETLHGIAKTRFDADAPYACMTAVWVAARAALAGQPPQ